MLFHILSLYLPYRPKKGYVMEDITNALVKLKQLKIYE